MNINTELKRKLIISLWIIVPLVALVIALDWWGMRIFPTRIIGKPVGGQVIERETGKPLPDALVIVEWQTSAARGGHGASGASCYHMEYAITDKNGQFKTERWVIYPNDFDFRVQKSKKQEGGIIHVVKPGYVWADGDWPRHVGSTEFFGQSMEPSDISLALGQNFSPGVEISGEHIKYKGLVTMLSNISSCDLLPLWITERQPTKPPKVIGEATRRALQASADILMFQGRAFATLYPDTLIDNKENLSPSPSYYAQQTKNMPYVFDYFEIKARPIPIELTTKPVTNFPDPPARYSFAPNATQ
jgi:hypothetical protein